MSKDTANFWIFITGVICIAVGLWLNDEKFRDTAQIATFIFGVGIGGIWSSILVGRVREE